MNKFIDLHPSVIHADEIADICRPLKLLGITYFSHANIKDGQFTSLANNPRFHQHYHHNEYYNIDIHMAKSQLLKDHVVWDAIECQGISRQMDEESHQFGVKHTFTIIEKSPLGSDYYHFATDISDKSINQVYLTHFDMLKLFIKHFNHLVSESRSLSSAYDVKFGLKENTEGFSLLGVYDGDHLDAMRDKFITNLNIGHQFDIDNNQSLVKFTTRQLEVAKILLQGKTFKDIGRELKLSPRTVETHVNFLKTKLKCHKLSGLVLELSKIII